MRKVTHCVAMLGSWCRKVWEGLCQQPFGKQQCVCVCVFPAANMEFPLFLISAIASWCNSLPVIYISHTCLDALTQPEMDRERERDGERERDSDMERTRVHTQTTTKPCVAIHSSKDEDTNSSGN